MKAWLVTRLGEPRDVLELAEVAAPHSGPGEALLDVEAVGLNFMDVSMCRGSYQVRQPLPFIPGVEIVGRIAGAPGVKAFSEGDRVIAIQPAGAAGGLAEQVVVSTDLMHAVPETMPLASAATLLVTYQTAYFALHRAQLRAGETLLVHAGAGGVGTAVIQLGLVMNARVLATAGNPEKTAVCRDEGAVLAIDYKQEDFVQAVLAATGGKGADVVCDQIGGEIFERSLECLAFEGRIVPIGFASGSVPVVPVARYLARNITVVGLSWGSEYPRRRREHVAATHRELVGLYEAGLINPRTTTVEFAGAAEAIQELGDGKTVGKVVIYLG